MSWNTEMVRIVRHLVNDLGTSPMFADSRLEETILVAAQLCQADIAFMQSYAVVVDALDLSPDPTEATRDDAFINLVSLKTAYILADALYRCQAQKAGIRVKDGPSEIDTTSSLKGYADLVKRTREDFEQAKWEFECGNLTPGKSILSPFSSPTIDFPGWTTSSDPYRNRPSL